MLRSSPRTNVSPALEVAIGPCVNQSDGAFRDVQGQEG